MFSLFNKIEINNYKSYNNQSEILIKFVLTANFNIKLKNWNIYYIKNVQNTYSNISKNIYL